MRIIVDPTKVRQKFKELGKRQMDFGRSKGITNINQKFAKPRAWEGEDLKALCEYLDCQPDDIARVLSEPDPTPPDAYAENIQKIDQFYARLEAEDHVGIISHDGFEEAKNEYLLEKIIGAARDLNVIFTYFVPSHNPKTPSLKDFFDIYSQVRRRDPSLAENFRCMQVNMDEKFRTGWMNRFVFMACHQDGDVTLKQVLSYSKALHPNWQMVSKKNYNNFKTSLKNRTDPIPICINSDSLENGKLPTVVQHAYKNSFSSEQNSVYAKIRDEAASVEHVRKLAAHSASAMSSFSISSRGPMPLRYLDVGCEDGKNTATFFHEFGNVYCGQTMIEVTGIDTSPQNEIDSVLKYGVFMNDSKLGYEETYFDHHFDVISFIHSTYCMSPGALMKAYRELTENGVCAILTSPQEKNILNTICKLVDREIIKKELAKFGPVPWKHDPGETGESDPLRMYGEDIHKCLTAFFGRDGFKSSRFSQSLRTEQFMDHGVPTEFGRNVVTFFTHNVINLPDQKIKDILATAIESTRADRFTVNCDSWGFVFTKNQARDFAEILRAAAHHPVHVPGTVSRNNS